MKAVVLKAFGDIDRLEIKDIPVPTIGEDEVIDQDQSHQHQSCGL